MLKTSYTLQIEKVLAADSVTSRCVLEQPEHEQHGHSKGFSKTGIDFRGWVLLDDTVIKDGINDRNQAVEVYLKGKHQSHEEAQRFLVEVKRPDVIRHFFEHDASTHPQTRCGFEFNTTFQHDHLELGFIVERRWEPAFDIQVKSSLTVLQGKNDWLFLDNDTNGSVGQHTGEIRLTRPQRKAWKQYMKGVQGQAALHGIGYCLLVAPAKEAVFHDQHPLPRAAKTVVDDMQASAPKDFHLLYPVEALRQMSRRSFRVTDTHWTSPGAAEASLLAVAKMGFDTAKARDVFARDKYRQKRVNGDLGIKTFPPQAHKEDVLTGYRYKHHVAYDNGLPNFGRVIVIHNPDATYQKRCLILGSSSAYSMLAYVSRIFSELVLVHCAGNMDEQVVADVAPDALLLQTNARFVVRAPECGYSLEGEMVSKLARLGKAERSKLRATAQKYADSVSATPALSWVELLHQRLLRALAPKP